jgi:ERCC4-related helicase
MNELLQASVAVISRWLEEKLPQLGSQWWQDNVVKRLTFQQQRLLEEKRVQSLHGLDMAAVLRVLDQNWSELAAVLPLPRDARNWVKELQSVRNRWAHAPVNGISSSDVFRDADTLERLLKILGADDALLGKIGALKSATLGSIAANATIQVATPRVEISAVTTSQQSPELTEPVLSSHQFEVGQLLCLRSNPSSVFPVLSVMAGSGAETRYQVFEGGARQVYYGSQLKALDEPAQERKTLSAAELSAMLTAVQLSSPSASALYSLNSGRVRFVPYQYRPVFKLIRADRPRLLVADEVGVGKTIEAGLILKELQARNDIKSVLIICPKALVAERKWELEMKRFDEHFTPLNGALLRHCIKETHLSGEWPVQYEKVILPTSLFDNDLLFGKAGKGSSRTQGLLELDPPPKFDLVIVDEAHHIRNSDTFLHQAVRYFADHAEAVVFLSATPVQLGRDDLFTLLNVLRPDVIIDPASFNQMAEPNQFINASIQACRRGDSGWTNEVREGLQSVATTAWGKNVLAGNPGFQQIYDGLSAGGEDGPARIKTIQALEDLYTFSSLINRTRRRDIGEFTTRKAETLSIDFTPSQKELHDDLLSVIARILARLHGNQNVKFMMSTVSRQAASSLYGLAPALEDILQGKLNQLVNEVDGEDGVEGRSLDFIDQIRNDIESLLVRAKRLEPRDPKADAFMKVVADKLAMPKNKVLVFSTFRHTLRYLVEKLKSAHVRFGLVHGGVNDEERADLRHRFSLHKDDPHALDILMSSEVGCEGLDFQFADCMVNYDLPWNPMRIEQRIGRIDRYGQQSETVAIVNLVTPGTIDAEIYDRCLSRIGVFQHAIGGNEEILGEITKELHDIAESFNLSEEERNRRLQQLSDNKIRQIEEEQRLEERQGELFGLNLAAASWDAKLAGSRNFWLEPQALASAVTTYLTQRLGKDLEYLLGDKLLKNLRLSQEARASILEDFRRLPRSTDTMYRTWEKWLKGGVPNLQVTFDQECAVENASAVLLSLGHPLLRQAAAHLQQSAPIAVRLTAVHSTLPTGIYPFALYQWTRQGAKKDEELVAVVDQTDLGKNLIDLLPISTDAPHLEMPSQQVWDDLDVVHHQRWLAESTQHAEENRQLLGIRIQSLHASHRARMALLEEQLRNATNEKIQKMRQSELDRAQVDFHVRVTALQRAADSGDIRANAAVLGVIEIKRLT